jgi:uncharacterized LabA/DUF88 family protein
MPKVDVSVFMDWQNVYGAAREAFDLRQEPSARGNFNPLAVARHLAGCNHRGTDGRLVRVEIHRGLPDATRSPKAHGAAERQRQAWVALDPAIMTPKLRPVRLNPKTGKEEEKGVDVALAVSALEHMLLKRCEVVIIFSHDTDMLPTIETICRLKEAGLITGSVETASWKSDLYAKRILPAKTEWKTPWGVVNHTLTVDLFDRVETPVNHAHDR